MGFEFLFLPENAPFSLALSITVGLFLLQIISSLLGLSSETHHDVEHDIDGDLEADYNFSIGGALNFIHVGKIPVLIILSIILASFGLSGIIAQSTICNIFGVVANPWFIAPVSGFFSITVTHFLGNLITKIFPKTESYAIHLKDLIGYEAKITVGTATLTTPAEAKVIDKFGGAHYIRVKPIENIVINTGSIVTLIQQVESSIFLVTPKD